MCLSSRKGQVSPPSGSDRVSWDPKEEQRLI